MTRRRSPATEPDLVLRIGEVAKLTGLTTRTLRYWEELDLITPTSYRGRGERLYSPADMARATRIKELQELLGFSLAEVRVVLDTEDVGVLDRVRSEYRRGEPSPARRRQLLDQAIEANDRLLERLDDTLRRIGAFREERAVKADLLREARQDVDRPTAPARRERVAHVPARPSRPGTAGAGPTAPARAPAATGTSAATAAPSKTRPTATTRTRRRHRP